MRADAATTATRYLDEAEFRILPAHDITYIKWEAMVERTYRSYGKRIEDHSSNARRDMRVLIKFELEKMSAGIDKILQSDYNESIESRKGQFCVGSRVWLVRIPFTAGYAQASIWISSCLANAHDNRNLLTRSSRIEPLANGLR
jgi:hypothetical protein